MELNWRLVLAIVFVTVYLMLVLLLRFKLPGPTELITIITDLYRSYGYPLVFLAGILEGMFLIGFYIPGSAAILLGAAIAKTGVVSLPAIIFLATLGLVIAYNINYFLGKYGWFQILAQFGLKQGIEQAQDKLKKHEKRTLFLGFISPNSGSFVATAAGVLQLPYKKFLIWSICSQLFWSILWGVVAYILGNVFVELFMKYFIYVAYGLILFFLLK